MRIALPIVSGLLFFTNCASQSLCADQPTGLFNQYCIDCHDGSSAEGDIDLARLPDETNFDTKLVFENIATGKMPPADVDAPAAAETSCYAGVAGVSTT